MKVYADLDINGDLPAIRNLLNGLDRSLPQGWSRDRERENGIPLATDDAWMYCFDCRNVPGLVDSSLWIACAPDRTYVSNIVPSPSSGRNELSHDQYYEILKSFYKDVLQPQAVRYRVSVTLSKNEIDLEDWMTVETAKLLRSFAITANKSTGSSHPRDRQKWVVFLRAANREKCRMSPDELARWLYEEEGFRDDVASQLAVEYELSRDILAG